jgi:hypothetical protein
MLTTRISNWAGNALLNALSELAVGGYLRIYDGSQPSSPDDAARGTMLAELRLGLPAFGPAEGLTISAFPIEDCTWAAADGAATWCRILQSDGITPIWDGSCGTTDANLILDSAEIQAGARVIVSNLTVTLPAQGK